MWGSSSSKQTITGDLSAKKREANLFNPDLGVATSSVKMAKMEGKAAMAGHYSPGHLALERSAYASCGWPHGSRLPSALA